MDVLDYDVCAFSTDGQFVAAAVSNHFFIKKYPFAGLYLVTEAACTIDYLQWNTTSNFVLCAQLGKGVLQVYDLSCKNWICTLKCGYFKFIAVEWICHEKILLTLEFHIALAIFDLFKNSIVYIEIPKPIWPCVVFDRDGIHMFVVSKINGYEKLLMMNSQSLKKVIYIQDILGPCDGLNKSPDNQYVCVFNQKKLTVLNFLSGNVLCLIESLSLNTVSWAPNVKYLALGCSSGVIIVLASSNEFDVKFKLCHYSVNEDYDFFKVSNRVLIKTKPSLKFYNLPSKIASIAWSFDCNYLSTFEVDSPFLYIWKKFRLICAIEFSTGIKKMQWCQSKNKLAVVCGLDLIFFWTEEQIPKLLTSPKLIDGTCLFVNNISWSLNNRDIILSDGKKCLLFTI